VSKKFLFMALTMALVFALSGFAFAQDDDTAGDDDTTEGDPFSLTGTANGEYPVVLASETEYEFAFEVFNEGGGEVAIKNVAITLPTTSYAIGAYEETFDGVHDGYFWQAAFDEDTATISWEAFGATSSVEMGDIQEGDMLTFSFFATTDTEPNDGFSWVLTGDDAGATVVNGIWFFGEVADDDDTGPEPGDDDTDDGDDDDDDDSGGCGC